MKQEKGSITLFVVVTCMFFITILLLVNVGLLNKRTNQEKELAQVEKNYAVNETELENTYTSLVNEVGYLTYKEIQEMIENAVAQAKEETIEEMEQKIANSEAMSIETAKMEAKLEAFPIGSIFISTNSTNPSSYIGGTWESYGEGRTIVGAGTGTDSNSTSQLFKLGTTGGEYTHTLTTAELPNHTHTVTAKGSVASTFTGSSVTTSSSGAHTHTFSGTTSSAGAHNHVLRVTIDLNTIAGNSRNVLVGGGSSWNASDSWEIREAGAHTHTFSGTTSSAGSHTHTVTAKGTVASTFTGTSVTTSSVGSGSASNNLQPYIVTYMWRRTE